MDVNRAKAIIESPDHIQVFLDGQSVWIDSVDSQTQTATVHIQEDQTESKTVRVDQLQEVH